MTVATESLAQLLASYHRHADDLRRVRDEQRNHLRANPGLRAQLDDVEAEITYLRLREHRPDVAVEIGCLHGWSTSWMLRALRDNGVGRLYSYDRIDVPLRTVPTDLAGGRWTFRHGDVRLASLPGDPDYLFIDAAHTARFARWYTRHLLAGLPPGTPVSVHDVFHRARPWPFSEGAVMLAWLRRRGTGYVTASPAHAPAAYARLLAVRRELGLGEPVRATARNPMLFFNT